MDRDEGTQRQGLGPVLTVPNLISFARLLGVPLFLYLFLATDATGWAIAVLVVGGLSDWVDGFAARRLKQVSRLGELLDPLADRLYILATLFALTFKDVVPWWFTIALLAREAVMVLCLVVLRVLGHGPPPVHYVGKTATAVLLMGFPMMLLAKFSEAARPWALPSGWALLWWGIVLYWVAAVFYFIQAAIHVRAGRLQASDAS
ncbi:CDP-alcohol phosphatidyltransferase family protein [Dactylosporangium aurantiacum]|uniref:CDP-alcohol phosphatidyltransferase family protein n=1 Tax=Dactylosporangium aurantiacum TaxID=35754 RepID=A0A9Q9ICU3_9ACTN|nr:CDP-alcohol phosphatidyltransferase family protein [Dactylosporangium aurantiacum]MDG6103454.1 CDP-alcohol phosphatidyltransferase family protein [Dactylosporangium aurantiacum]UWZ52040.1 CDP-alcohol phosphatidyltransferase family protein [Dactylosporangium aurantiacum]